MRLRIFGNLPYGNREILFDKHGAEADRWYEVHVPIADDLYNVHLAELRKEGLIP